MKKTAFVLAAAITLVGIASAQEGFDSSPSRVPTSIGEIKVRLIDTDGTTGAMRGEAQIDVLDANGEIMRAPTYDIRIHGNAAVKQAVLDMLNAVRAQAEAEIIP